MTKIYFYRVPEFWRKEDKYRFLQEKQSVVNIEWQELISDEKHLWLTEGLHADFDSFIPMGTKEGKAAKGEQEESIFKLFSLGVATNRDIWVYNFNQQALTENVKRTIEVYNEQVFKWSRNQNRDAVIDDFVLYDDAKISWSSTLKRHLEGTQFSEFTEQNIRPSLYRPFAKKMLYFETIFNDRRGQFPSIFPTTATENENRVICCTNHSQIPFVIQITNCIPSLDVGGRAGQCFPFYTYSEDGSNRQENLTNWALKHFRSHYQDDTITKWAIFYYIYGLLHHPHYREKYAANLKRELPRIPLATDFWAFSKAGERLAELHIHYEKQPEYPLQKIFKPDARPSYLVEKMRLTKEKDAIIYNETLTLRNVPPEVFNYRLGNRSALEWIIDQYQVKIDGHSGPRDNLEWLNEYQAKTEKGSGIRNDPNRLDDEEYILRLIGQVITVSLETVRIVEGLAELMVND
jgi:predicted helicase